MELNRNPGLFDSRPPLLEDAGLEDTALPAQAVQEAFKRAADALQNAQRQVQSTATGIFGSVTTGEENFAKNPGPRNRFVGDSGVDPKGVAVLGEVENYVDTKAGGFIDEGNDLIVVQGAGLSDKVVFGKEGGPKLGDTGCVEGLADDKGEKKDTTDDTEDGPILVLA